MMNITTLTFQTVRAAMLITALASSAHAARLGQAVITQKVNQVTLASSPKATAIPASAGAVVKDDNIVRTGVQSRAELEFADKTLARLGANTTFSFDADTSTLDFQQGAVLFCKPKGSGPLQIKTAAVTAAITGTTGFVSTIPAAKKKKKKGTPDDDVVLFGILEGSLKGKSTWVDDNGQSHDFRFSLAPGEMLVAEPGVSPMVAQFDLARFVNTSPLLHGFSSTLPNAPQIERAVAAYQALVNRGFIDPGQFQVASLNNQLMFVSNGEPPTSRFDPGVRQLVAVNTAQNQRPAPVQQPVTVMQMAAVQAVTPARPTFENVGGNGQIRGQLVWLTDADLDLHLVLPDSQHLYYATPNKTINFNNALAMAKLDVDNQGDTVTVQPNKRVENIVITGVPSRGDYTFYVQNYETSRTSDSGTLLVTQNGGRSFKTLHFTLGRKEDSMKIIVKR